MHNFAICLTNDDNVANIVLNVLYKKIKQEIPKSNISVFASSHGNFSFDCGIFCLSELWYFAGEIFVFDMDSIEYINNLHQDIKINFVFFNQNLDIKKMMELLNDNIVNIHLDRSSLDNFSRITGRNSISLDKYIELCKNIEVKSNE